MNSWILWVKVKLTLLILLHSLVSYFIYFFFLIFRELECAGVNVNKPSGGICQSENEDVSLSSKDNL